MEINPTIKIGKYHEELLNYIEAKLGKLNGSWMKEIDFSIGIKNPLEILTWGTNNLGNRFNFICTPKVIEIVPTKENCTYEKEYGAYNINHYFTREVDMLSNIKLIFNCHIDDADITYALEKELVNYYDDYDDSNVTKHYKITVEHPTSNQTIVTLPETNDNFISLVSNNFSKIQLSIQFEKPTDMKLEDIKIKIECIAYYFGGGIRRDLACTESFKITPFTIPMLEYFTQTDLRMPMDEFIKMCQANQSQVHKNCYDTHDNHHISPREKRLKWCEDYEKRHPDHPNIWDENRADRINHYGCRHDHDRDVSVARRPPTLRETHIHREERDHADRINHYGCRHDHDRDLSVARRPPTLIDIHGGRVERDRAEQQRCPCGRESCRCGWNMGDRRVPERRR